MTDFYNTCQLDLINIEPERRIELIPVDHKRKQKRQTRYEAQSLFLKTGIEQNRYAMACRGCGIAIFCFL